MPFSRQNDVFGAWHDSESMFSFMPACSMFSSLELSRRVGVNSDHNFMDAEIFAIKQKLNFLKILTKRHNFTRLSSWLKGRVEQLEGL